MRIRREPKSNLPEAVPAAPPESPRTDGLNELMKGTVPEGWSSMFGSIMEAFVYSSQFPLAERAGVSADIYRYAEQKGHMPKAVVHHLYDRAVGDEADREGFIGGPIHRSLDRLEQDRLRQADSEADK
jgi:hypothetical protein